MATLFISDLHLDAQRPATTQLFLQFLSNQARQADALFILGDLFEAWVGDDDDSVLVEQVAVGIQGVTTAEVPVYFIHGNRDFLLGENYARYCGMQLLPETHVIELYGEKVLIMHGDTLCTDDQDYQVFRAKVRDPLWQQQMLALSLEQRRAVAEKLRIDSQEATQLKADGITDVNADAVIKALQDHRVKRLIHGHTHRPAIHDLTVDGQACQRVVLGDWYQQGSVLTVDDQQRLQLAGLTQ